MSDLARLAKAARDKKAAKQQQQQQQNDSGKAVAAKKAQGGIPELDLFDYTHNQIDTVKFNDAYRKLKTYVGRNYGYNSHVIEYCEEYTVIFPARPTAEQLNEANDPAGLKRAEYLEDYKSAKRIVDTYNANSPKVYQVIWGQCTVSMRNMLRRVNEFERIEREKDVLDLWKAIVDISMNGTAVGQDQEKMIIDAQRRFQLFKQQQRETVGDFHERYEIEYQALISSGGSLVLQADVPEGAIADPEIIAQMKTAHQTREEKQKALIFINKLDRSRFKGLLDDLQNAYDRNRDEYPNTLNEAYQIAINYRENGKRVDTLMSNHGKEQYGAAFVSGDNNNGKGKKKGKRFEKKNNNSDNNDDKSGNDDERMKNIQCYLCGEFGHMRGDCPILKKCRKYLEKEGKREEESQKALMTAAGIQLVGCTTGKEELTLVSERNSAKQISFDDHCVLCDNQSSVDVFCNAKLLTNLRKSDTTMIIAGVNKNGKPLSTNLVGDFGWYGTVYFHPQASANILSFHNLVSKFKEKVWFNSKRNAFFVRIPSGDVKAFWPLGKHYALRVDHIENGRAFPIDTVTENKKGYTPRELEDGEKAADLYEILGRPSYKEYIKMVNTGRIINCPITAKDIVRAVKIWGPDLGTIKGKMTRKTPEHIENVEIKGVFTDKEVILCVDICFISGLPFIVSISRRLCLLVTVYLPERDRKTVLKAIGEIKAIYGRYHVSIKAIFCDGEGAVSSLRHFFEASGIKVETASKNEHVPEVERSIRVIKERVRSFVTTYPAKMPSTMFVHLVYYCVFMINSFPRSSSIDTGTPPRELITGKKIDFKRDCALKFGQYVQVHEDELITNTMKERTLGALSLGPVGNQQNSYNFLNLKTWNVLKRRSWVALPMPDHVISMINAKAEIDTANLKKKGFIFSLDSEDTPEVFADNEGFDEETEENEEIEHLDENITDQIEPQDVVDGQETLDSVENDVESPEIEETDDSGVDSPTESTEVETIEAQSTEENVQTEVEMEKPSEVQEENKTSDKGYHLRPYKTPKYKNGNVLLNIYVTNKTSKSFGPEEKKSIFKEMKQLHDKKVFHAVHKGKIPKGKVLHSILFMKVKRDGTLKSRFVCNGSKQDARFAAVDPYSPTVSAESIFITIAIEGFEERIVITIDIEGAYLHVSMEGEVFMLIEPFIASILVEIDPEKYRSFLDEEGRLYVQLDKALYGCIESGKLFYLHLNRSLKGMGFVSNPYDDCVFNKVINEKNEQCTVTIHVDDLKVSCKDEKYLEQFVKELTAIYGTLNVHKEKILDYLGMDLDYTNKSYVKVSMVKMIEASVEEFGIGSGENVTTPATDDLFAIEEDSEALLKKEKEKFHSMVARLLYMAKRARPDILTCVSFLSTRVLAPTKQDWKKITRVLKYLNGSKERFLKVTGSHNFGIEAFIDASFACHMDRKGHTGMYVTIGKGAIYCKSSKQKLVAKSSTEAELIAVGDSLPILLWMRKFIIHQGYINTPPIKVYQDNQSTIQLIKKGKSNSMRTKHIDIRYFFTHDRLESGELEIVNISTNDMIGDYLSKAVVGSKATKFISIILNFSDQGTDESNDMISG